MGFSLNNSLERSSITDDIRMTLSSKPVIVILTLSALFRIVIHFLVLPNSPSVFGPDEAVYATLAKYVSEGLPVQEFPNYGAGLYNSVKSLIIPSALLVQLGMDKLSAVRAIASVYGLASSLVLVLCFITFLRLRGQTSNKLSPIFDRKFLALLLIFTFFPSNFVWSTIGLRESGSQFWLITTFYLILKLLQSTGINLWKFTALTSLALTLAHGTRPETALVFGLVALLTSIVLIFKFRKFLPLIAILLGVFAGQSYTTTPKISAEKAIRAFQIIEQERSQSVTPEPGEILAASANESATKKCKQVNEVIRFQGNVFRCKFFNTYKVVERKPMETLWNRVLAAKLLEYKRNVNAVDAQSALPTSDCQGLSQELLLLIECNSRELPYRLFAFLFRPLVFFDQGSTTLTFAAMENLGWMILVPFSMWISLHKRESNVDRFISFSLTSYVLLYASTAALYEGNLGTAFRHKSTILWPLIFILMITPRILPKLKRETKSLS